MIFDSAPALIVYVDKEHRVIRANRGAERILGRPREMILGKTVFELFPPEYAAHFAACDQEVMRTGHPQLGIIESYHTAMGEQRWCQTDKIPLRDARGEVTELVLFAKDITERKRAEESLAHTTRALKTLSECNLALVRANEEAAFLQEICRIIVESGGYQQAWVAFIREDAARTLYPVAQAGFNEAHLDLLHSSWPAAEQDRGNGEPQLPPDHLEICFGGSTAISLPLMVAERVMGALKYLLSGTRRL